MECSEVKVSELHDDKLVILVVGPVGSGKTTLALNLARNMAKSRGVFYFDKDALVPVSNVAFNVANQETDRHSVFFKENLRDPEYDSVYRIALEGILWTEVMIINAPFSSELKAADGPYFEKFHKFGESLHKAGANLMVIYCEISPVNLNGHLKYRIEHDPGQAERDPGFRDEAARQAYCQKNAIKAPPLPENSPVDCYLVFDVNDTKTSFEFLAKNLNFEISEEYDTNIKIHLEENIK